MKERPILFSAAMVRALLDGSKTQTRRVCKPMQSWVDQACREVRSIDGAPFHFLKGAQEPIDRLRCPHGQPGDRIWVRETWGVISHAWDEAGNLTDWTPDRPATVISEMPFGQGYYSGHVIYAADGAFEWSGDDDGDGDPRSAWHPSIHMPRRASRILLEIVSVRIERLNDCSEADALAEGISAVRTHEWDSVHFPEWRRYFDEACARGEKPPVGPMPSQAYAALWDQINGAGAWTANPWVWAIEFKRVTP